MSDPVLRDAGLSDETHDDSHEDGSEVTEAVEQPTPLSLEGEGVIVHQAELLTIEQAGDHFPREPQMLRVEWPAAPVASTQIVVTRNPNFMDAFLFGVLMLLGVLVTTGALGVSLHFHWFGLRSFAEAQNDTRLALGTQLAIYLIGLAAAVPFFQMLWGKGFFDGLHWHWATARRLVKRLIVTAILCNVIAMIGNYVLPFPQHAPIDKMFGTSADAWILLCFGVTIAPLFEEMIFRGFLVPAMATAWDWCYEKMTHTLPKPNDAEGNPQWSRAAMIFAALVVSAPFALMHAAQVGSAWGPISLLYCVSLILCAVRLWTKSLAASTVVHSAYNFMLFAVMLVETDGFRHLDKM